MEDLHIGSKAIHVILLESEAIYIDPVAKIILIASPKQPYAEKRFQSQALIWML